MSSLRKLTTDPHPKDQPNAPTPESLTLNTITLVAPPELCGLTLHTPRGALPVPNHGQVRVNADHTDMLRHLRGRGFRTKRDDETTKVDPCDPRISGQALQRVQRVVALNLFKPSQLQRIGGDGNDFLRAFADRARNGAAAEPRVVQPGGRPSYCTSAAEFRRAYFGERS